MKFGHYTTYMRLSEITFGEANLKTILSYYVMSIL